jgi:AcrR family transcriptional regulator
MASGDVEAVSIESVAEAAGVSRPLVYKHFANRTELLAAVYRRESILLQREIAQAVNDASTLEGKIRAYVAGCLQAEASRGATFAALRSAGVRNETARDEQRTRDRTTVRYFAELAVDDFGIEERRAREALSVLLGSITAVLAQWRRRPTADHAKALEEIYVGLAIGGLRALGA